MQALRHGSIAALLEKAQTLLQTEATCHRHTVSSIHVNQVQHPPPDFSVEFPSFPASPSTVCLHCLLDILNHLEEL